MFGSSLKLVILFVYGFDYFNKVSDVVVSYEIGQFVVDGGDVCFGGFEIFGEDVFYDVFEFFVDLFGSLGEVLREIELV